MDDRQSAMLWQLMQSISNQTQDNHVPHVEEPQFENTLLSLRPLLAPKQQKILDLLVKMHEIRALMDEVSMM